jgi:pantetheine-phosphate adenylyltransferase
MKVLYTGSFNPWHKGHQYVYDRCCSYFGKDNVFIGVGINPAKVSIEQQKSQLEFLKWTLVPVTHNVITYSGLTSEVCQVNDIKLIARGIRPGKSLEYEEDLMYWNYKLGNIETIYIPTPPEINQISSSVIRELKNYASVNLKDFVNEDVYYRWLQKKIATNFIYFGKSCSGKSTYLNDITQYRCGMGESGGVAVECDKVIYDFVDLNKMIELLNPDNVGDYVNEFVTDIETFKKELLWSIRFNIDHSYANLMDVLGRSIDYERMFGSRTYFDAPIIGNYFKYIPKHIISKFNLVKISTSEENRIEFAKAKGWSLDMLKNLDAHYQDPPYWDKEIIVWKHAQ